MGSFDIDVKLCVVGLADLPLPFPLEQPRGCGRTEWNVRDADGTVISSLARVLTGGSKKTVDFAIKHNKPWLHLHKGGAAPEITLLRFIREHAIATLNVAGPRASKEPEVGAFVKRKATLFLDQEQVSYDPSRHAFQ